MKKNNSWKNYFILSSINPVIRILTISDFIILSGFGLIGPIFAVFIIDNIPGGSVEVVGIAEMIYLLTRSSLQVPIALIIDRIKGERDDFWILFIGSMLYAIIILLYIFVRTPFQLYAVQFFYGLAGAFTLPTWYALFTRHVDKKHEGVEWGIYRTLTDIGGAGAAAIGGFLAYHYGFTNLFIFVSALSLLGGFFLLIARKNLCK